MKTWTLSAALLAGAATLAATPAPTMDMWNVDPAHTEIGFTAKHFFTPVKGTFRDFDVHLIYDPANPASSSVDVTVQVASVETGNERRNTHLQSGDFFEAERYPTITFKSTAVRRVSDSQLIASGDLTIKGTTKRIELPITVLGIQQIPSEMQEMLGGAKQIASFSAGTTLDRGDFGVGTGSWAATLVVGGEIQIDIALEANLK
ncbi:MAG: YceI family protein [Gemmatimonadota bacterium]